MGTTTPKTPPAPKSVWAKDLVAGDRVINVGRVEAVHAVGNFVVAQIRAGHWSLATGGINNASLDRVFHAADTVILEAEA